MALSKVQPGQKLQISASTWNTMIEAARDYQARVHSQGSRLAGDRHESGVVLVKNTSGQNVPQFGVLGIDAGQTIINPASNEQEFRQRVILSGVTPTSSHTDRFGIAQEPINAGSFGRVMLVGVTICRVNVQDQADTHAESATGTVAHLASCAEGTARILWRQSGTGTKWAVVQLGIGVSPASPPWLGKLTTSPSGGAVTVQRLTGDWRTSTATDGVDRTATWRAVGGAIGDLATVTSSPHDPHAYIAWPFAQNEVMPVRCATTIPAGSLAQIVGRDGAVTLVQRPAADVSAGQLVYCPLAVDTPADGSYTGYAHDCLDRMMRVQTSAESPPVGQTFTTAGSTWLLDADPLGPFEVVATDTDPYTWVRRRDLPANVLRVTPASESIPARSIVKIVSYDAATRTYTVGRPDEDGMDAADLLYVESPIVLGTKGLALHDWTQAVEVTDASQDAQVGDHVGTSKNTWGIKISPAGPWRVVGVLVSGPRIVRLRSSGGSTVQLAKVISGANKVYTVNPFSGDDIAGVWIDSAAELPSGAYVGVVAESVAIDGVDYEYWGWPINPRDGLYRC